MKIIAERKIVPTFALVFTMIYWALAINMYNNNI